MAASLPSSGCSSFGLENTAEGQVSLKSEDALIRRCLAGRQARLMAKLVLLVYERTRAHLWEPAGEVVHDHSGDQRLAQPGGQGHKRVVVQGSTDDVQLVGAFIDALGIDPGLRIEPATHPRGHRGAHASGRQGSAERQHAPTFSRAWDMYVAAR